VCELTKCIDSICIFYFIFMFLPCRTYVYVVNLPSPSIPTNARPTTLTYPLGPEGLKFRRLRLSNPSFQKKLVSVIGAVDLLLGLGFEFTIGLHEGVETDFLEFDTKKRTFEVGMIRCQCESINISIFVIGAFIWVCLLCMGVW